jgi:hypothetical protein
VFYVFFVVALSFLIIFRHFFVFWGVNSESLRLGKVKVNKNGVFL